MDRSWVNAELSRIAAVHRRKAAEQMAAEAMAAPFVLAADRRLQALGTRLIRRTQDEAGRDLIRQSAPEIFCRE